jgi:hypothetical protein
MTNIQPTSSGVKTKLLLALALLFSIFDNQPKAQLDVVFQEDEVDLTNAFRPLDKMTNNLYEIKYRYLHRNEGLEVYRLLQTGSIYTRILHKSGAINFSSEATRYLNDLKDFILKDYPRAAKDIQIFITYNPTLNAFATINKNIYVNVGLLARVYNEAQLAFILSHEIMHIIENHSVEHYRKFRKEVESIGQRDVARKADQIELIKHTMSQEHEFEADKYGMYLYLTAGYEAKHAYDALKLLKEAYVQLEQKRVSAQIMGITQEKYEVLVTALRNKDFVKNVDIEEKIKEENNEVDSNSEKELMTTHPKIDDRLVEIQKIIEEFEKSHKGKADFIVNENLFKRIKEASIQIVNNSHNKSSDFVSAYLINAARIVEGQQVSKSDYEHMAYAIFGLIHDKKYKMRYDFSPYMSYADSLFYLHYLQSSVKYLTFWGLEVLEAHRQPNNADLIDNYMKRIVEMVSTNQEMRQSLEPYIARLNAKPFESRSLSFSDINFQISMSNYLNNWEKKNFNKQQRGSVKQKGKIAFLDMNNIAVDMAPYRATLNFTKSDELDAMNFEVFQDLRQKYPEDLLLLIPNGYNYNGRQYTNYSTLLRWVIERIYFDQSPYQTLYSEQIKAFREANDVRYLMIGLNLTMRRKQLLGFSLVRALGVALNPFYAPLALTTRRIEQSRNYQLTIIFDLETSELVFWDKRTSIEPLNTAFMYNTYDDILKTFKKESKLHKTI